MLWSPMLSSAVISTSQVTVPSRRINHFFSMDWQRSSESEYRLSIDSTTDGLKPNSKASLFHFVATACTTLTSFCPGMMKWYNPEREGRFPIEKVNYASIITGRYQKLSAYDDLAIAGGQGLWRPGVVAPWKVVKISVLCENYHFQTFLRSCHIRRSEKWALSAQLYEAEMH